MQFEPQKRLCSVQESCAPRTTPKDKSGKSRLAGLVAIALSAAVLLLCIATSYAGSATWDANPENTDWNNPANWTPQTVPNGPNDTATFEITSQGGISISANTEVNGLIFNPSTHSFVFLTSSGFTISGSGVVNNSGHIESFIGSVVFTNSSGAGNELVNYSNGARFYDSATASTATFNGSAFFYGSSTAANGTFTKNLSFFDSSNAGSANVTLASGVSVSFAGNSSAANAQFAANGGQSQFTHGATVMFAEHSSADNSILIANGGVNGGEPGAIAFSDNSAGAMARVELFGNGNLNIAAHIAPGISVGSIEGDGNVTLGTNRLTVGVNNIDTTFSGQIHDSFGKGSLAKTGSGTLVLANSNTYGDTIIDQGVLRASHDGAFGTPLQGGTQVIVEASGTLTLDSGATNNYIDDKVNLQVVSGSTINLNFAGAGDRVASLLVNGLPQPPGVYGGMISGAPNQLPQFTGTGTIIVRMKAVSRKVHGAAGTFDIDLPLAGPPGIECRSGGPSGDHQIVLTFFNNVTFRTATVTSGTGFVASSSGNGTRTVTINLSNVANAQTIKVALVDANDGTSTNSFPIPLSVLVGDINGSGSVNGSDVTAVKHTSQMVDASNFRADVIANGVLNSSDVAIVKFNSGTALP